MGNPDLLERIADGNVTEALVKRDCSLASVKDDSTEAKRFRCKFAFLDHSAPNPTSLEIAADRDLTHLRLRRLPRTKKDRSEQGFSADVRKMQIGSFGFEVRLRKIEPERKAKDFAPKFHHLRPQRAPIPRAQQARLRSFALNAEGGEKPGDVVRGPSDLTARPPSPILEFLLG